MRIVYMCFVILTILCITNFHVSRAQQAITTPTSLMISYDISAVKTLCNDYHCHPDYVYAAAEGYKSSLAAFLPCDCLIQPDYNALLPPLTVSSFLMGFNLTIDQNCFGPKQLLCGSQQQTSCARKEYCNASPEVIALGKVLSAFVAIYRCVITTDNQEIKDKALRIHVNGLRNFACCDTGCDPPLLALTREFETMVIQLRTLDNKRCSCARSDVNYCNAYNQWYPKYEYTWDPYHI